MSRDQDPGYRFFDQLPIESIDIGSTVLVAGPALSAAEDLALSMVVEGTTADEGMLFISTNKTVGKLLTACRRIRPDLRPSRIGVVDCTGQDIGTTDSEAAVKYVSTQSDLTGIGMKYSALYESLYQASPGGRVRTGMVSLSSLVMYVDLRDVFRFAQTLANRIDSANGLGVFSIDPSMHDTRAVSTLNQLADVVIEVRDPETDAPRPADGDVRVRGLRDQSSEWQPFGLP